MNAQSIVIGLIASVAVLYFIWQKFKNQKPNADIVTSKPPAELLLPQERQNDKLVIVRDTSCTDLQTIVMDFCNMYNKESCQAQPRLTKITETEFAITFPFDIEFEIFCYFINYIQYPIGFDKSFNVTGWTTTKRGDNWITEKSANKEVMLFIPLDDTDHDNVFMTTADNIGFKLGFSMEEEKQLLAEPKKNFSSPTIDNLELVNMEHKDFR